MKGVKEDGWREYRRMGERSKGGWVKGVKEDWRRE